MPPEYLDSRQVSAAFDRAAPHYEQAAALQKAAAEELLQRLDYINAEPRHILDIGCGTGAVSSALALRYPQAQLYALDISWNMLKRAGGDFPHTLYVRADAAEIPLADGCADLLVSNLMLQWCSDFSAVFREFSRVLSPGGKLLFSTFGPDTLHELRSAWAAADAYTHVNRFVDMHDLGDALLNAGLANPVMDADRIARYYPDCQTLMQQLKNLGAHNVNAGRPKGMQGKGKFKSMLDAYEARREKEKGLPATFEVIYGYAQGGGQQVDSDGSVRIPVSEIISW
ncbi:MAG: malonyl-ACP O-methyltransferase BioC [Gammaproteobacteria bacterium]|nr:malonyl-ACP O-methyltransferase BioC [Gammaproteobacteria bacterium]